ncbi:uncharacterized protein LOC135384349 [Ornithodoros turicata]|uniref:uncharacterized protein LOC135384349 n=1 Tax=Ornithodoros turicata TaxID=34597 RepID=UPI003138812B
MWNCLQGQYLAFPSTTEEWRQIASEMETGWQFPNCIGSIDGKHIVIECPAKSGSQNYNYKGTFSVVLLTVCDDQYRFTYVDMGHLGGESDAGIFARSKLLQVLEGSDFGIPGPRNVGTAGPIPHCIVGDEAFPLRTFLMRPYSRRAASEHHHKIFNYRLSRARRLIENAFGILANRWRILRRPFKAKRENVERIVKACVVLHNFVMKTSSMFYNPIGYTDYEDSCGNLQSGAWRADDGQQQQSETDLPCIL